MRKETFQDSDMTNLIFDGVAIESGGEIVFSCRSDWRQHRNPGDLLKNWFSM
jgi:hypothetical protein